jgi:hypothetical protein
VKSLLYIALFAGVFWFTSRSLMHALPGRGTTLIETKVAWFEEHATEYDTIFLGSSRCYRGFRPELFDEITKEHGIETRAFNFGTPGSRVFENYRILDRIEEFGHELKWVFIDPERLEWLRQMDEDMLRLSYIEWHDPATTWMVFRYVLGQDMTPLDKLARLGANARSCGYHLGNIGGTTNYVDRALGRDIVDQTNQIERLGARLDGWLPLSRDTALQREEKNENFNEPERRAAYLKKIDKLRRELPEDGPVSDASVAFYARVARKIEDMGAVPIFVIQSGVKPQHDLIRAHREGLIEHLLRYDDPDLVPELFEPENRWDQHHLRISGAEIFTSMLARDFVRLYEAMDERP